MYRLYSFFIIKVFLLVSIASFAGDRYNFNSGWLVKVGKDPKASGTHCDDAVWQKVTLPYSFNQTEAFGKHIAELTDTVAWYRKHFILPENMRNAKKFFIEFEGVRFGARCFLNGKELGWGENGIMAFGFDLTPYIKRNGENILAVYVDNEKSQWQSDGLLENAWVTFQLERPATIKQISVRLLDFRKNSYPLEITTADGTVIWTEYTPKGLGNVCLNIEKPVKSATYKIRMLGPATVKEAFGSMTELAAKKNVSTKAAKSNKFSIIEIEFNE